ncbi:PEP/pyruvate-binding domain-containing protein [Hydrogenophaga sp.]|uniref:PEP/pyruvate-binding domain-containing protein n=1 Tax=Hydrogenophaga sp. TaxID=1904254 RepID=UPI00261339A7|nr:PEP/pyruvate-binding domain-containing protein [Hydrogenophaga sp.]MCW5653686.1 PEP/pyruvate-binding domain-containing protein [Hydrogenophaga sp.]
MTQATARTTTGTSMNTITTAFEHAQALDKRLVGGKAHGLATMAQAGIPVAPGFAVTTQAYEAYLRHTGLDQRLAQALGRVDREALGALEACAREVEAWFDEVPLPDGLMAPLAQSYASLCQALQMTDVSVAVRSSATAEDSAGASFAGEYETFVGLRGIAEVERHLRRCWASAFSARALTYAWKNGIDPLAVDMGVVVQKTVHARAAGVMFTVSPVTGDRSRIVIEASYGLGLGVVGGDVTPDRFVVAKVEGHVIERVLGDKHIEYLSGQQATPVDDERRALLCMDDAELTALAKVGKRLERLHGAPQDIEFALDRELPRGDNIVLLQCRPVTVLPDRKAPGRAADDALMRFASGVLSAASR